MSAYGPSAEVRTDTEQVCFERDRRTSCSRRRRSETDPQRPTVTRRYGPGTSRFRRDRGGLPLSCMTFGLCSRSKFCSTTLWSSWQVSGLRLAIVPVLVNARNVPRIVSAAAAQLKCRGPVAASEDSHKAHSRPAEWPAHLMSSRLDLRLARVSECHRYQIGKQKRARLRQLAF
jgi:hypothetical protein